MPKKLELTRRRLLGGLGTIGVASAGAGLGTSAYLNDTEEFTDNSLTAGTLNLALEGNVVWTNRTDGKAPTIDDQTVTADGAAEMLFSFEDVKPGDCYIVQTDEIIEGNPAYLQMSLEETGDTEGENPEPEPQDGSDPNGGELDDRMEVTLYYGGYSGNGSLVSNPAKSDLGVAGATDQLIETQTLQDAFDDLAEAANDSGEDPTNATEYEALPPHQTNINDEFVPGEPGTGPAPFEANDLEPGRYRKFWLFCLPAEVGNEVQGDTVEFTIKADVVQTRHNDDPFNTSS